MRVRDDVSWSWDHTLVGRQFVVGIKDAHSFVKFDRAFGQDVEDFIRRYRTVDIPAEGLTARERTILANLKRLGYLDTSEKQILAFNEFRSVARTFFSVTPPAFRQGPGNSWLGVATVLVGLAGLALAGFLWRDYLPGVIDYRAMSVAQIALTAGIYPWLLLLLHELGHLTMAWWMGVDVEKVTVGWFIVHPIILVQYRGLNLETQRQRAVVMIGGISVNFFLLICGLGVKAAGWEQGPVVDIWIAANLGYILTNLSFLGMTDGYFLVTMFLGLTNLRAKGYRFINGLLNGKLLADPKVRACGITLSVLYLVTVANVVGQALYIGHLFELSRLLVLALVTVFVATLTMRFGLRIKKAFP